MLQSFLVSTSVVALAEIGDKTQLLSLVLAARYRKPLPILLGVLVATITNHACAGGIGTFWRAGYWCQTNLMKAKSPCLKNPWAYSAAQFSPSSWRNWATRHKSSPSRWRHSTETFQCRVRYHVGHDACQRSYAIK